ncbi:TIGR03767 family metallophosphoesterase [Haloechinothrix sp. LS1_15]|uniref:TIGR03767 family metallophosphoesterase n=1 Tax=Haloechinothrix sp. LS1_15 TaxID=2652248 RepID=UPI0029474F3E|nr:TIGR03767 family metallophosphoesterase [Haloechinothrix sp. LS1_15]MDV6014662.1 TIGR03767 family metallophosphoesterase [Haloechinothrix sp. LS1_15]
MSVRRRDFLGVMTAAVAATSLPGVASANTGRGGHAAARSAAALTTLARTLGPGSVVRPGRIADYREITTRDGEPHLVRAELADPHPGRHGRRRGLLSFVHLTDQHVIDVQSTTRVEFLDRYADGECGEVFPFSSAHRPQEAACGRIAEAMLRRVREIGVSPVTGTPLQAAICTGDNTDNQQGNELGIFLDLMDGTDLTGRKIAVQSGDADRYEGVQASGDRGYWHPDPDVTAAPDQYKELFGFPDAPGWLEKAVAPFAATGAGMPWFSCYGNHDGLAQGNSPVLPPYRVVAERGLKVVGTPLHATCNSFTEPSAALDQLTVPGAPAMRVTADAQRQYVSKLEWIRAHLESPGAPRGHGFTEENIASNTAYYARNVGGVRWIVLDTVNPGGLATGSIGRRQLAWLDERLSEADRQEVMVMLFSHHGPRSLDNPVQTPDPFLGPEGNDLPRHNADAVLDVVAAHPSVIAWVNGHTHDNIITSREGPFWDIGTAAHIDWPSQARLIDVLDNRDGTVSLFTTLVDHADDEVASFARELMANDPQKGFDTGIGADIDRNTELVLPHPFRAG